MPAKKTRRVATREDLGLFVENCFKDIRQFKDYAIEFDKELFSFTLKLKGERYNSTITTPVMEYLLAVQKGIYALYRQYAGRNPTREEKKRLELVVRVEKGSSDILFSILDQLEVIKGAVQNMNGDQTFAAIVIAVATWGVVSLGKKIFDHLDKKHAREIELQKEKARSEKDRQVVEAFSKTVGTVTTIRKNAMGSLGAIEDNASLSYSGEILSPKELRERVVADRKREEPDVATITGSFRITRLHFNFETNSAKADMHDAKTDTLLASVEIQPRSIIDGTFAVLKKAHKKQDVDLQIIVRKKGKKIIKATLDKIL
ncbi:MAG: hypothetical protein LBK44_03425 [Spirochaetales bacterium]|jgi:hypothetical protein|nr:hypothetical protein [Spirochaetales bacterium]